MHRLQSFLSDRLGWPRYLGPFMEKPLPADLHWTVTLGSVLVLLFALEAVTGMLLAFYYNPSPGLAYQSVDFIMHQVQGGRILRGIHHYGAAAMVILVFSHLASTFFYAAFKPPRELTWMVGVCLFLLVLAFGFTGYLLPWDQKAYWATVVGTNIPRDIPLIGPFITRLLLGGDTVSGLTLTRFFAVHTLVLPVLSAGCIGLHIYLVRIHGISEPPARCDTAPCAPAESSYHFFPEHLARSALAFTLVFAVVLLLAAFADIGQEDVAGTLDPTYLPRPEWYFMWLFQLLTLFSGRSEIIGSLVIPLGAVGLLFCLPFLGRSRRRHPFERPTEIAVGAACLIGIVYLSAVGIANSKPYGEIIRLPDRPLTSSETAGLRLFVDRDCAYCHNVLGAGGHMTGPDLSNAVARDRTKKWLTALIKDPQSVSAWSIMPKYDMSPAQLNSLADFILALDFKRSGVRTVQTQQFRGAERR